MSVLAVREGYQLWARSYSVENAVTQLENGLASELTPSLAGLCLLDAGCGTGRRLHDCGATSMVGVDLSPEMLEAGRVMVPDAKLRLLTGDVRALPLPDATFDIVWCRLVVGHLPDCGPAYAELGRVVVPGGRVIVTDFHPAARAAGHRRTFRSAGEIYEVEHYVHSIETHRSAARAAGLHALDLAEARIGPEVRSFYDQAGRSALYQEHVGLPVVLALSFVRDD
jgi:ubiquinone/menaquinone biosynthesis C-methylase UbiE